MLDNPGLVQQNHCQRVERAIFAHIYPSRMAQGIMTGIGLLGADAKPLESLGSRCLAGVRPHALIRASRHARALVNESGREPR